MNIKSKKRRNSRKCQPVSYWMHTLNTYTLVLTLNMNMMYVFFLFRLVERFCMLFIALANFFVVFHPFYVFFFFKSAFIVSICNSFPRFDFSITTSRLVDLTLSQYVSRLSYSQLDTK